MVPSSQPEETGLDCEKASVVAANATYASSLSSATGEPPSTSVSQETLPHRVLSTPRLLLIHFGAALTLFLATTDATIVSTMLPCIAKDLTATSSQYTWVGVAYLLTQTAFQPLYGNISDIFGRKKLLYVSLGIFALGSLLCGISKDITMLIASRAFAGIGGGGIVSCVWVITSEIVPPQSRAKWSQALSITWSCSAVAGPLLGGAFSGTGLRWRWGFYLNLPISFIGFLVLWVSLRSVCVQKVSDVSCRSLMKTFDFGGLILFMCATICLIVGFSFTTEIGWNNPTTIGLITSGVIILALGGVYEAKTTRERLFPPTMFKNPTAGAYFAILYWGAADGLSPFESGIQMLPYSLGSSLASIPAAWFIGYWQSRSQNTSGQNWIITIGLFICTLGFGLLNLLHEGTPIAARFIIPLVAGVGLGLLLHAPYQVFAKALKPCELATGTGAFFLVRFTGATIGLSIAGAIFDARARTLIARQHLSISSLDLGRLKVVGGEVVPVISSSIQMIWTVCTPLLGAALLLSLLLRSFPIEENVGSDAGKESVSVDQDST